MLHDSAYHEGHRRLQDQFDCRRIADRLEQVTCHTPFTDSDRAFIERLLFLDWEQPSRVRVNGEVRVSHDDPLLASALPEKRWWCHCYGFGIVAAADKINETARVTDTVTPASSS